MAIVFILLGLVLLVVGGEFLVRSSVAISFKFKISKMIIGLTVVSFATSLPELLVSLQAAIAGSSDISLGNVVGSNIANIGLVLGITALITNIAVDRDFYRFNWPVMMLFSIVLYFCLQSGGGISRIEGIGLVIAIVLYLVLLLQRARRNPPADATEEVDEKLQYTSMFKTIVWLIIGGVALYFGSDWLVNGAVDLAEKLGVSERVISVTMIAVGTSVPELAASVIAALKKEKALSIGNLIGSNIFNIASVLGITAIIQPIKMQSEGILTFDIWWMIGFAFVLFPLVFLPKKYEFTKYKGLLLVGAYAVFVSLSFL